tara:strand:+ start:322 stop:1029 length:708 start_codon:yes stop_codon:yes gene_type:complete
MTNIIHGNLPAHGGEWAALCEERAAQVRDACRVRNFLPGEPIYYEGDQPAGVYCLTEGLVGIRKTDAGGDSMLLRLVRPGQTFGYRALLMNEAHGVGAEALKESRVCHVPAATVNRLMAEDPTLTAAFFRYLAREMEEAENKVMETMKASSRIRFLRLLLLLCVDGRDGDCDGEVHLELPVSRQDIASLIGVRSETMSRVIRAIEADGLARFKGRRVEIPDPERLAAETAGSLAA